MSCTPLVEEGDDFLRGAGLTEPRENVCEAVAMRLGTHVGHGVDGERDVEARLIGLPCRGFDTGAGGDAGDHHLRHAARLQLALEIGARERAPRPLGYRDIAGLPGELGNEVRPSIGEWSGGPRLFS